MPNGLWSLQSRAQEPHDGMSEYSGYNDAAQLRPLFLLSVPPPALGGPGQPAIGRIVLIGELGITSLEFSGDNDSLVMMKVRTPSYAALVMGEVL